MKLRLLASLVAGLIASWVSAQQYPSERKGFEPDKVFAFGDLDNVNVMNGNLMVRIPLGPSYPVSSNLAYSFSLTYNSKTWEYQAAPSEITPTDPKLYTYAIPWKRSNAGLGWLFTMGQLFDPDDPDMDGVASVEVPVPGRQRARLLSDPSRSAGRKFE